MKSRLQEYADMLRMHQTNLEQADKDLDEASDNVDLAAQTLREAKATKDAAENRLHNVHSQIYTTKEAMKEILDAN